MLLLANIGTAEDAERAAPVGVEGVGLFRTEVLFLDRSTAPSHEEQADVYARVLETFEGRKVVIRTLDAGADKPLAFATQPDEENPALVLHGLGVSSLSMSASAVPLVRFALRHHSGDQCRLLAEAARSAAGAPQARASALALVDPDVRTALAL